MSANIECPTCGSPVPTDARFCPVCTRPRSEVEEQLRRASELTGQDYEELLSRAQQQGALNPEPLRRPESIDSPQTGTSGRKTAEQRREQLGRSVTAQLAQGNRRIETQGDFSAVIISGSPINHILHLILTVLTFGIWAFIWILLAIGGGEKRELIAVDEFGNTSVQKLT